jgi:hypothetical protein
MAVKEMSALDLTDPFTAIILLRQGDVSLAAAVRVHWLTPDEHRLNWTRRSKYGNTSLTIERDGTWTVEHNNDVKRGIDSAGAALLYMASINWM